MNGSQFTILVDIGSTARQAAQETCMDEPGMNDVVLTVLRTTHHGHTRREQVLVETSVEMDGWMDP